ncbi:Uncharacterised protein [uncultured archaeon]|nr:Uncharacterised protein [uncultured archaeon]
MNTELINFITEARRRKFGDTEIKSALLNHRWPLEEIDDGFNELDSKNKLKNQILIFLDDDLLKCLEKRAKKNLLTVPKQIEDILRRSVVNQSKTKSLKTEKLDDTLVSLFSRKKSGRKKRRKKN